MHDRALSLCTTNTVSTVAASKGGKIEDLQFFDHQYEISLMLVSKPFHCHVHVTMHKDSACSHIRDITVHMYAEGCKDARATGMRMALSHLDRHSWQSY